MHWVIEGVPAVWNTFRRSEVAVYSQSSCDTSEWTGDGCSTYVYISTLAFSRFIAVMSLVKTVVFVTIMVVGVVLYTRDAQQLVRRA